jgi:inhibitor of KinA sporulation pathway (predicted exonuclease)
MRLTSIRQEDVDAAAAFPAVLAEFAAWVGAPPVRLASWSAYDLAQLRTDCARHAIELPAALESHLDLQALWARRREGAVPAAVALERLGLVPDGVHHRALDDARNIARIARRLLA